MTLQDTDTTLTLPQEALPAQCPVDHSAWSWQKTAHDTETANKLIERDEAGVWHIRSFEAVRDILRICHTPASSRSISLFAVSVSWAVFCHDHAL